MGVDYTAVLAVGKVVEDDDEAIELLEKGGFSLSDEEQETLDECGLEDYLSDGEFHGIECETLNCYSGWGRAVGIPISVNPVETFADRIKSAQAKWQEVFGEAADIIHTVKVW